MSEFSLQQFDSIYPKGIEYHYWSLARNRIIQETIIHYNLQNKRMLEIGCGTGVVLESLRGLGFDCYGVDLAQCNADKNSEEYIHYKTNFEDLKDAFTNSIEVVLLFDVIEHIQDEKIFLEKIQHTFPNLTHIIVTVPARDEIMSNYDTYNQHFRRYSIMTLETVARLSGLKTLYTSYFFHALYVPARLFVFLNILRGITIVPPQSRLVRFLHTCISLFFYGEYKLIPRFMWGTSLITVMVPDSKKI